MVELARGRFLTDFGHYRGAGGAGDRSEEEFSELRLMQQLEANHAFTALYAVVEVARSSTDSPEYDILRTALSVFCIR